MSARPLRGVWPSAFRLVVEHGASVLPLRPRSKVPACARGVHEASRDPEAVARWADRLPSANVGLATGAASGLVVLDVDGLAGEAALAMFGPLPVTPVSRTARGRQLFFRAHPLVRNSAGALGPELDTRGDGGYVVLPPSVHPSGVIYAWEVAPWDAEPAAVPPSLLEAIAAAVGVSQSQAIKDMRSGEHQCSPAPITGRDGVASFDPVEVLAALRFLDCNDYETWRDVGLALKASDDPAARGLWDAWSAGSMKYDPAVQERQWRAMKPTRITTASIFHFARAAGWRPTGRAA